MPLADDLHTRGLICIFSDVQKVNCPTGAREAALGRAAVKNDLDRFVACGRRTLRGFFDTLNRRRLMLRRRRVFAFQMPQVNQMKT